jgi:hypothetical protein
LHRDRDGGHYDPFSHRRCRVGSSVWGNIDTELPGLGDAGDEPLQHGNAFVYR